MNGNSPGSNQQVNLGQTLNFAGLVADNVGLAKLTVNISGPKGNDLTVVTNTVSGTSQSLSSYSINTSNTNYAGVAGNYTATIFAKDTSNNVSSKSWNFSVVVPDTQLPTFSNAQLNGKNPGNSSQVSLGQTLSFAGSVSDNVGLARLTVNISGPKGNDLTVVTNTVSGTSRSLSSYSINTSNTSFAGVAGNYTATIFAKDTSNNVSSKSWNFSVVVPDINGPRVVSHTPSGNVGNPVSFIDITFDKPINSSSFTTADVVSFTNGNASLGVSSVTYQSGNTYRVNFLGAQTTAGIYTMVIGPTVSDLVGNLMNQDGDSVNGELTQDRYTATFSIAAAQRVNRISSNATRADNQTTPVAIQRVDSSDPIDPNVDTWIVIHGLGASPDEPDGYMHRLGGDATHGGPKGVLPGQVLALDWNVAAGLPGLTGEGWIEPVGQWAAGALSAYGFTGSKLNLIGHSWGSYVADELAEAMPQQVVNTIVGLDPAANTIGSNYNVKDPGEINFGAHSNFSWAFHSSDVSGNEVTPTTADVAFRVTDSGHFGVLIVDFFSNLTKPHDPANTTFSLDRLRSTTPVGPWTRDRYDSNGNLGAGLYEAVISADNGGNLPDLLTYVSNTSGQTVVDDLSDQISEAFGVGVGSITQIVTTPVNKIRAATDVDMFAFSVTAGQRIEFDIDNDFYSLTFNSYLRLFNSNGTELASNDNGAAPGESSGNESYLGYTFTAAGTYFIGASGSGNGAYNPTLGTGDGNGNTGGYTLMLTPLGTTSVPTGTALPANNQVVSLRSYNFPDHLIRHRNSEAFIDPVENSELFRLDSSFRVRPGLADPAGVSFESVNYPGSFLRHQNSRLVLSPNDGSELFRQDATFFARQGLAGTNGVSFESLNYPGHYLRHSNYEIWLDSFDGSNLFREDATFLPTA